MSFISVQAAKAHMNITDDTDDTLIQGKIDAAEAYVEQVLGKTLGTGFAGSGGVPDPVTEAILQLTAHLYENREASIVGVAVEEVPFGFWTLLMPYREFAF